MTATVTLSASTAHGAVRFLVCVRRDGYAQRGLKRAQLRAWGAWRTHTVTIPVWVFSQARLALLVLLGSLCVAQVARAESPYDARQQRLADAVLAKGREPEAMLDLLRMNREADEADPELVLSLFKRIAAAKTVGVEQRMFAARRVAWDLRRTGDTAAAVKAFDELGYLRKFRVIGPFDNEGKRGFDTELGPEATRTQAANLSATYSGRERQVKWRTFPEIVHGGYISFDAIFRPTENVCALAETSITVPKARTLTLWVGGGGATKVYFNGQEALRDEAYRRLASICAWATRRASPWRSYKTPPTFLPCPRAAKKPR
jgi:hypothetical protein